jgi:YbbR domain-containing protein
VTDGSLQVQPFPEAVAIPSTVNVTGPSPVIAELEEIRTQPIDIDGLSQSGWILEVALDETSLPSGVDIQETTVDVWVPVQEQRVSFEDVPIQVINVDPEYRTTLSAETVSFEVDGPQDVLDTISGTTPLVVIDGQGRGPGTYRVSVQVVLPAGVSYTNLEPAQVDLTVIRTQPQSSPPVSMPRTPPVRP